MQPSSYENPLRRSVQPPLEAASPMSLHRRLPGYVPTPLRDAPPLAERLGVARVLVKDEASRLGLPAFKMLGASWACYRSLVERLGTDPDEPEPWQDVAELAERFAPLRPLTLATATDGNHGRAVARFARLLGLPAEIWVPAGTVRPRVDAIEGEGATVTVVEGGYDDAVRAAADAADERTVVVSDTSWPGYEVVPKWVVDGYATIFDELDVQLAERAAPLPDVVVVPVGVGAFAAAVVTRYRRSDEGIVLVGVEPVDAACVLASARAGELVTLPGEQRSIMAGLNCGTPSPVAWPLVSAGIDWFVAVDDDQARDAMRSLAGVGIVSGESGAASLAG
ncbi:MAG: diaminopropionate ammonia-lyase, partial [Acidimicrobiales bacterium]